MGSLKKCQPIWSSYLVNYSKHINIKYIIVQRALFYRYLTLLCFLLWVLFLSNLFFIDVLFGLLIFCWTFTFFLEFILTVNPVLLNTLRTEFYKYYHCLTFQRIIIKDTVVWLSSRIVKKIFFKELTGYPQSYPQRMRLLRQPKI